MALIVSIEETQLEKPRAHEPAPKTTASILDGGSERLIQIDTYVTVAEYDEPVLCQTVQLNKASAKQLIKFVHRVFPDLK